MSIKLANRKGRAGKYKFDVLHHGFSTPYTVQSNMDRRQCVIYKQGIKVASCNSSTRGFGSVIAILKQELKKPKRN